MRVNIFPASKVTHIDPFHHSMSSCSPMNTRVQFIPLHCVNAMDTLLFFGMTSHILPPKLHNNKEPIRMAVLEHTERVIHNIFIGTVSLEETSSFICTLISNAALHKHIQHCYIVYVKYALQLRKKLFASRFIEQLLVALCQCLIIFQTTTLLYLAIYGILMLCSGCLCNVVERNPILVFFYIQ